MHRKGLIGLALTGACLLGGGAGPAPDGQDFALIEHGRYLATIGDCVACHTAPGGQMFAGGHIIATPFGTILSSNITPDRDTGIGAWTDDDFVRLMQEGVGRGGKHIYPAMPYPYYTHVTREDDLAIRAWFATLLPVSKKVVTDQLPFPINLRVELRGWNLLFFQSQRFSPDPARSAGWNRGAYLVTGLGHCGACHTPKNLAGADEGSHAFQGAVVQDWFAPNITGDDRRGLGRWSVEDTVEYLSTGHNRFAAASGPMAEEVSLSSSNVSKADLRAMAVYLKSLPGQPDSAGSVASNSPPMRRGAAIYASECSACHTPGGTGIAGLFPQLAGAPAVQSREATSAIRVVLQGGQSVSTHAAPTGAAMPAFGWMLSDAEVADVVTFIRNAWGNAASSVRASDVADTRSAIVAERP